MHRIIFALIIIIGLSLFTVCSFPVHALPPNAKKAYEKVETVKTRPGVSVDVLVIKPNITPLGVLLVFPGQNVKEFESFFGLVKLSPNFVVRTAPQYIQQGYAVAIMNEPSDDHVVYYGGVPFLDPEFRKSQKHLEDVRCVMEYLVQKHGFSSFYFLGTSLGSVSILYLASEIHDQKVKGFITTASFSTRHATNDVATIERSREIRLKIKSPVLIVHHANDFCPNTPFEGAVELKSQLMNSSRVDLIKVFGDTNYAGPRYTGGGGFECGYYANHGFYGLDEQVTQAIGDWCAGKPVPTVIGDQSK